MKFPRNMCLLDRTIRIIVGITLVYLGFFDSTLVADTVLSVLLGIIGLVNLGSALLAYCPIYHLANISTAASKLNTEQ